MPPPPVRLNRHFKGFRAAVRKWHAHPRVLVEGDSWVKYDSVPFNPTPANLFLGTCEYFQCVSLSLTESGDTVSNMLGPFVDFSKNDLPIETNPRGQSNLGKLADYLKPESGFDLLFFSGGGNDVVDNLANMLRPFERNLAAQDALIEERVRAQMEALRRGYRWLLGVRDRISPRTRVVTHQYGVPNLRKGGFKRLGINLTKDWIKPQFRERGYLAASGTPSDAEIALMTDVVERLMQSFGTMLAELQSDPRVHKFYVGPTRSVLAPEHWRDEMHLTDAGFRLAARQLQGKLRELFPRSIG